MKNKIKKIISFIFLFIVLLVFFSLLWSKKYYQNLNIIEVIFYLNSNISSSSTSSLKDYFFTSLLPSIISSIIIYILLNKIFKKIKNKKIKNISILILILLGLFIIIYSFNEVKTFSYIKAQLTKSNFIKNNYVDSKKVKLEFPKKKKNLIYIYLESFESSYFSKDLGGLKDDNLLKGLMPLMNNNINFSNTNKYGGAYQINYLSWTTAGMVSESSGIPLKFNNQTYNKYKLSNYKYLNNDYSLGDILNKNGYNQELMLGSLKSFGDRDRYFKDHGNYYIYDLNLAKKKNKISKNYDVNWGFEDEKLFKFAKEEITKLSKEDKPFNFTMLTSNTHFPDGYIPKNYKKIYKDNYSNAIYNSANEVYDFINWISKQDFYDNTTIIISGDHLSMQKNFFKKKDLDKRTVFNLIINSSINTNNNKNREFTTMDMFPTTLASLGVKIDGDRLGLGTNLYSNKKTLVEKYGLNYVNDEISKKSDFYNYKILE